MHQPFSDFGVSLAMTLPPIMILVGPIAIVFAPRSTVLTVSDLILTFRFHCNPAGQAR